MIDLLIPELQKRGLFWNDYAVPGGTYRENLTGVKGQNEPDPKHPAHAYIWRAAEEKEEMGLSLQGRMAGADDGSGSGSGERAVNGTGAVSSSTASRIPPETLKRLEDRYATALR